MVSALACALFDVITCDDVRLVEVYGYDLGRLGSAPIASIAACGDPHDRAALDGASGALQDGDPPFWRHLTAIILALLAAVSRAVLSRLHGPMRDVPV